MIAFRDPTWRRGVALALLAAAAATAQAQVTQFEITATSPTTVRPGQAVDFVARLSVAKDAAVDQLLPGDPEPPLGETSWMQSQRLLSDTSVALDLSIQGSDGQWAGGLSFGAGYGDPGPAVGVLHGSLSFAAPGQYAVDAFTAYSGSLSWSIIVQSATRSCSGDALIGFVCTPWVSSESRSDDGHHVETGFSSLSGPVTVTVLAVPEPAAVHGWLAGLGLLGTLAWRRRGPPAGTERAAAQRAPA